MSTPAGKSIDALNDAWNQLHLDVCGRGLARTGHADLCAEVQRARAGWREWWQSAASAAAPATGFDRFWPMYQKLRTRALADGLTVTAPNVIASPAARAKAGVRKVARLGQEVVVGALVIAVLVWAVSQQDKPRRYAA